MPSASLISVNHDLERVAHLCDDQQIAAALDAPHAEARTLLVHRRGHAVVFRSLPRLEALALTQLQHAARFEAFCEHMAEHGAGATSVLDGLLRWVDDGLIFTSPDAASRG